ESVAIGARAASVNEGDVALGSDSVTAAVVNTTGATLNGVDYTFAGTHATSTVSVGAAGAERTLTNVAAGQVSADSTDAINGSQLYATNVALNDLGTQVTSIDGRVSTIEGDITNINGVLDGAVVYDRNADGTVNHDTITLAGTDGTQIKNVADGVDAHDAVNVGQLTDPNSTISTSIYNNVENKFGDTVRYFKADGLNDGTDDAQVVAGTNSAAIGANSVADRANTVSVGSAGHERQIVNVAAGTQDTDAVNVSQLKGIADVIGGGTTINNDGTITNPSFVINGGDTYTTVADAITNIDGRVTTLEGDITNINNGGGIKYFHANSTLADSVASGTNSVAVGPQAVASADNAVAIGNNAQAASANSVALGANSKTADAVSTTGGTVGGTSYTYAGGTAAGTVSVGDAGTERTITNVAAGRVSADSTDAVNGSQLYATNQAIETLSGTVSSIDNRV
ncbi:YadA family autotransporter adhesin, partial [Uliginosibacterium sp. sgz301328]|uniref:YadA family autotransporter adhesin n=1 Tax=Uliginosibacterium sp. sgz301328 TaxID=3243764 RepID=UPI00359D3932